MAVTREKQVNEAIKRMESIRLMPKAIEEFKNEGKINYSDCNFGFLYWLTDKYKNLVKKFEKENNCVVYHAIHDVTNIGEMLALFYVSNCEEEWEADNDDLKDGYSICYVENLTYGDLSEFGSIMFKPINGGLRRVF